MVRLGSKVTIQDELNRLSEKSLSETCKTVLGLVKLTLDKYGIDSSSPLCRHANTVRINQLLCGNGQVSVLDYVNVDTDFNEIYLECISSYARLLCSDIKNLESSTVLCIRETFNPDSEFKKFDILSCITELGVVKCILRGKSFSLDYDIDRLGYILGILSSDKVEEQGIKLAILYYLGNDSSIVFGRDFKFFSKVVSLTSSGYKRLPAPDKKRVVESLGVFYLTGALSENDATEMYSKIH